MYVLLGEDRLQNAYVRHREKDWKDAHPTVEPQNVNNEYTRDRKSNNQVAAGRWSPWFQLAPTLSG